MIGLEGVKDEVDSLTNSAVVDAYRVQQGMPRSQESLHMVFEGPAGTGKTTIAREIGKLYNALGLLPTSNFKEVERADLIAGVMGETAQKVRQVFYGDGRSIPPGVGGVIFIDEAYNLVTDDRDAYGKEAVAALLTLAEKHRDDTVVILAGYDEAAGGQTMQRLMSSNPGMSSRFPRTITFPSYSNKERFDIAVKEFADRSLTLGDPKTRKKINSALSVAVRETGSGNARDVRNLVDAIVREQSNRVGRRRRYEGVEPTKREVGTITVDDITAGLARYSSGLRRQ